jgi:anaerobic selenocysteine-containing dehydrogenase
MFADYVLPVAAYYEKYGIKYAQSLCALHHQLRQGH